MISPGATLHNNGWIRRKGGGIRQNERRVSVRAEIANQRRVLFLAHTPASIMVITGRRRFHVFMRMFILLMGMCILDCLNFK